MKIDDWKSNIASHVRREGCTHKKNVIEFNLVERRAGGDLMSSGMEQIKNVPGSNGWIIRKVCLEDKKIAP